MKNVIKLSFLLGLALLTSACNDSSKSDQQTSEFNSIIYKDIEFEMPIIAEPTFAKNQSNIVDFGAIGDGRTLNSEAFAKAIEKTVSLGGGKVIVPKGVWLTGPIYLKSNINLEVQEGALILFSEDKSLYPLIETSFEGLNTVRCTSPIYSKNETNIAITGKGIIDGNGKYWQMVKRVKLTVAQWKKKVQSGGITQGDRWYPSEQFLKGEKMAEMNVPTELKTISEFEQIHDFLRPVMVSLVNCKTILLDGPVFQNSPAWNIHPLMCENLIIRNLTVRNPWYSQNGDGIDIESCKNTVLYNSTFDVGDDAICIKSGKDKDGRERDIPTENLIIKKCVVYHGHGGVTVGSEMSSGVKNMHVSDCLFMGTDVGLRFKSKRGRGGVVEGVYISHVSMVDIPTKAISFNMYYGGKSMSELIGDGDDKIKKTTEVFEVNEETPVFKDIYINDIVCKGADQAIYLQGLPEMKLSNVHLKDIHIKATKGLSCLDTKDVTLENITLITEELPVATIYNSENVTINNLVFDEKISSVLEISGTDSKQISVMNTKFMDKEKQVSLTNGANKAEVTIK